MKCIIYWSSHICLADYVRLKLSKELEGDVNDVYLTCWYYNILYYLCVVKFQQKTKHEKCCVYVTHYHETKPISRETDIIIAATIYTTYRRHQYQPPPHRPTSSLYVIIINRVLYWFQLLGASSYKIRQYLILIYEPY